MKKSKFIEELIEDIQRLSKFEKKNDLEDRYQRRLEGMRKIYKAMTGKDPETIGNL